MCELSTEEKRELFVKKCLDVWRVSEASTVRKLWAIVTGAMEFVGSYEGWEGADKKIEVYRILESFLDKTDSPGPDFLVDPAILWMVDGAIDSLYNAFKGRYDFDGPPI